MRRPVAAAIAGMLLIGGAAPARAESCTPESFRAVVDEAGKTLRRLHDETQPRLDAGFRRLKAQRGWSEDEYLDKASAAIADDRSESFDVKAGELLSRLDRLAEVAPGAVPDCTRLGELEATAVELTATVRSKLRHMLARLEAAAGEPAVTAGVAARAGEIATEVAKAQPTPPAAGDGAVSALRPATDDAPAKGAAQPPQQQAPVAPPKAKAPERTASQAPPPPPPGPPARSPVSGWTTSTIDERKAAPSRQAPPPPVLAAPAPVAPPPLPPQAQAEDGFSLEEIREASRGFFGSLSSELAGVIEHAFSVTGGRPTGYILGNEGGGAFIAGVRYGRGTLITRTGASRQVYWHGPSIGYDFGASGSKTLFLVYRLHDPLDIFAGFSGVDGSAYLVGGVGMTLLTDGRLVLAPIRTGLGLRLGANIGYVRFTPRPTWNPF